ncbi:MAG: LLM class flavin-dependent oxidoreductase [Chloroflexi bacterium]|nr:LLM class flavin-dependent oxidoreductase [Chloroflexota bacterium]
MDRPSALTRQRELTTDDASSAMLAVMRPFRFLAEARQVVDGRELAATARRSESIGYSVLVISDHLTDQLAPIPAMAIIAAATERLRIGTFVLNNDLRHPAVLAQDLATLDVLSSFMVGDRNTLAPLVQRLRGT